MNKSRYLSYSAFETIILAPAWFHQVNHDLCAAFDRCLSYEDVSAYLPEFRGVAGGYAGAAFCDPQLAEERCAQIAVTGKLDTSEYPR